jgi:hypothetical protein
MLSPVEAALARRRVMRLMIVPVLILLCVGLAHAQTGSQSSSREATANAPAWNPPRTPDGQPDIQGNWTQQGLSILSFGLEDGPSEEHQTIGGQTRQINRPSAVIDPADGRVPYQPWAAEQRNAVRDNHTNMTRRNQVDPQDRCFLNGATRFFSVGNFQFIQTPGHVVMLSSFAHTFRVIRLQPGPALGDTVKLWQGDSRGRWEGNTLVVTSTNHNDKTWFDKIGSFHSDTMRVTERFTPVNPKTITYLATVEDPRVFTRPWTIRLNLVRGADEDMIEEACWEGDTFGKESFAKLPK